VTVGEGGRWATAVSRPAVAAGAWVGAAVSGWLQLTNSTSSMKKKTGLKLFLIPLVRRLYYRENEHQVNRHPIRPIRVIRG
jgi:hypothetical protein